jgi:18S rRNA (adenine1779-N6/adenine1780-N6)-dimethyltransferase
MIPTNKKHGQHLLKNPGIVDKIVAACDLKPSDTVFEIGPGTGNLTMRLLETAKKVVAYEIDGRMASEVRKRAMGAGRMNLEVQEGDCLRGSWPAFDVCAANLPYQISSPFTFRLLAHRPSFRCAVLMFQKEFAERLIADVGESQYGRLALNTRLFVKVSCVCKVSRGSFNPPPEVDSMVVKVVPRYPPIEVDFREWDGLMRICFGRKRKTLRASFLTTYTLNTLEENYKTWCALTGAAPSKQPVKDMVLEALAAAELTEARAIRIDLDTYFKLLLEFNKRGIHFSNMTIGAKIGQAPEKPTDDFFVDDDAEGDEEM